MRNKLNLNTLLLSAMFSFIVWQGKNAVRTIEDSHDSVIQIRTEMIPRKEFDTEINLIKVRLAQVELEINKLQKPKQQ